MDSKLKKCQYKRKGCSRGKTFWNENLKNLFKNASDAERAYCKCKGSKVEKQLENSYSNLVSLNLIKNTERLKGPQIEKEKLNLNH